MHLLMTSDFSHHLCNLCNIYQIDSSQCNNALLPDTMPCHDSSTCLHMAAHVCTWQHMAAHAKTAAHGSTWQHMPRQQHMATHFSTWQHMATHGSTCHAMTAAHGSTWQHICQRVSPTPATCVISFRS